MHKLLEVSICLLFLSHTHLLHKFEKTTLRLWQGCAVIVLAAIFRHFENKILGKEYFVSNSLIFLPKKSPIKDKFL
jgi:hypothetical protein